MVVRAALPVEGVTLVASASLLLVEDAEEPVRVEVVMVELLLWWVEAADAPVVVAEEELESVLVAVEDSVEDSVSVSVELAALEVPVLEAEAEAEEEALGAALLVLSITKGGV